MIKMKRIVLFLLLHLVGISLSSISNVKSSRDLLKVERKKKERIRAAKFNSLFWSSSYNEIADTNHIKELEGQSGIIAATQLEPISTKDVATISDSLARKMKHSGE